MDWMGARGDWPRLPQKEAKSGVRVRFDPLMLMLVIVSRERIVKIEREAMSENDYVNDYLEYSYSCQLEK